MMEFKHMCPHCGTKAVQTWSFIRRSVWWKPWTWLRPDERVQQPVFYTTFDGNQHTETVEDLGKKFRTMEKQRDEKDALDPVL